MSKLEFSKTVESETKYAFAKNMVARMFAGDKNVFEDCCTEDFRHRTPEFHMINDASKEGWMEGAFAVETMSRYFRADGGGRENISVTDKTIVETEDLLIWEFIWSGENPIGEYAGFKEGERREGMKVNMRVVEFWRFRDGKVCEIDAINDSLNYYYDMVDGNWKKVINAITNNVAWYKSQRDNISKGEYPIPDPGKVF